MKLSRTPGLIIPSAYPSKEILGRDLQRRDEAAGFTPFEASDFDGEDLLHFGVKGMKWGQHKQKQLDSLNRIATGKAGRFEKARFKMNVSLVELMANKGSIQRVAAGKAFVLQAQKDRIESGQSTKADKLDRALNTSLLDLARGR